MERVTESKARRETSDEERQKEISAERWRSEFDGSRKRQKGERCGKYLWRNTWGRQIKNKRCIDEDKCTDGDVQSLVRDGQNSGRGAETATKKEKGKSDMLAKLTGGKEDGKVILPVLFIPAFIPFSHLAEHKPSRWENGSLGLGLLPLVSKVTGFIS